MNSIETVHASHERSEMTTARPISQLEKIRLGGLDQWIRIEGKDASNPVLLLIQQGPGLPMINEVADVSELWHLEDDFVVVACLRVYFLPILPLVDDCFHPTPNTLAICFCSASTAQRSSATC